jgi:hypothetical protein
MAYGRRVAFEPVRTVAFGGIGAAYAAVGTATIDQARLVSIFNATDANVTISLDGATDHIIVGAGSGQVFDLTANEVQNDGLFLKKGTIFSAKRTSGAPSTGSLWIQVMYAQGGV